MGIFDKLKSAVDQGLGKARRFATPFTDQGYLLAAVAVGFVVGGADGDFDQSERDGMIKLIEKDETLSAFDADAVASAYQQVNDLHDISVALGTKKALKIIGNVSDPAQRESLMEFACVIATLGEDEGVSSDERAALDKISAALNVPVDEDLLV